MGGRGSLAVGPGAERVPGAERQQVGEVAEMVGSCLKAGPRVSLALPPAPPGVDGKGARECRSASVPLERRKTPPSRPRISHLHLLLGPSAAFRAPDLVPPDL